jgi:hypothetical protein
MRKPKQVSTHTFNGRKYRVNYAHAIYGMTDVPAAQVGSGQEKWDMTLILGNDFKAFHSAFHESLEASGYPSSVLHDKDGNPTTTDAARFLWRTWVQK